MGTAAKMLVWRRVQTSTGHKVFVDIIYEGGSQNVVGHHLEIQSSRPLKISALTTVFSAVLTCP